MNWLAGIDGYCERLGPGLMAEPLNALTNVGFVIAALWMWRRMAGLPRSAGRRLGQALCLLLASIGAGSGLFHLWAAVWASLADVVPIALFVLLYVYAGNRIYLLWPVRASLWGVFAVVPFVTVMVPVFARLPGFAISAAYWPVPLLIFGYALALRRRSRSLARGLAQGAAVLCLSLVARSLDAPLCAVWPLGTHFLWHLLNAGVLGWMIEVLRRHLLARDLEEGQGRG